MEVGNKVIVKRQRPDRERPAIVKEIRKSKVVVEWSIPDNDQARKLSAVPLGMVRLDESDQKKRVQKAG